MRCLRIDHCGSKSIFSDIVQLLDKWIVALTPTNGLEAAPVLEAVEAAASVLELDLTFNTSYLTDSYIIFSLKMESVSKDIFGYRFHFEGKNDV